MKTPYKYALIGGLIALILISFLVEIKGILLPFVLAFVLAYLLNPLVSKVASKIGRPVASGLVVGLALLFFILVVMLLIPIAQTQISDFISKVPLMADKIWSYIQKLIMWGRPKMNYQQLYQLSDSTTQAAVGVLNGLGAGLNHVISGGAGYCQFAGIIIHQSYCFILYFKGFTKNERKIKRAYSRTFSSHSKRIFIGFE